MAVDDGKLRYRFVVLLIVKGNGVAGLAIFELDVAANGWAHNVFNVRQTIIW